MLTLDHIDPKDRWVAASCWNDCYATPLDDLKFLMFRTSTTKVLMSAWALDWLFGSGQCREQFGSFANQFSTEEKLHYLNKYFTLPSVTKGLYEAKPIELSEELPAKEILLADKCSMQIAPIIKNET